MGEMSEDETELEIAVEERQEGIQQLLDAELLDIDELVAAVEAIPAEDAGRLLSRLKATDRERLLEKLPPEEAAALVAELDESQAADIVGEMPAGAAARLVEKLDSGDRADILDELDSDEAEAVMAAMTPDSADKERERRTYPEGSAGELMAREFLGYPIDASIFDVVHDLRNRADDYAEYAIQYAYVVDQDGVLRGVLRLRDILLGRSGAMVRDLMIPNPASVPVDATLDKLISLFKEKPFMGMPVVGESGVLLGVLGKERVDAAEQRLAKRAFLRVSGIVGGEELRSMPLGARSVRRLAWLIPNIVLNLVAASVIAAHQATLEAAIALAVFLPIVSDMSGCSGNQAVAVSIRELSMGLLRPGDALRVFLKEAWIGVMNGAVLGILLGSVAGIWQGNVYLGAVVGSALALNTMLSVVLGGLVPLLLKKFKVDPALASGPILTTVTDMCGFFLVLSFAGSVLDKIV
ncbi:MAG: magnesium transporter [Verrucomicrobiales bacterium]|jgi:magnesium transporter